LVKRGVGAGPGERQSAGNVDRRRALAAIEERRSQLGLQGPHLRADCRLAQVERAGSPGERAVLGNGYESTQRMEAHAGAPFELSPRLPPAVVHIRYFCSKYSPPCAFRGGGNPLA